MRRSYSIVSPININANKHICANNRICTHRTRWVRAAVTPSLNYYYYLYSMNIFLSNIRDRHLFEQRECPIPRAHYKHPACITLIVSVFVIESFHHNWFYHIKFMSNRTTHSQRRSERLTMDAKLAVLVTSRMHTTFYMYHPFSVVFPFQHFAE